MMSKTKQEVRDFLNSQVGLMVNKKCGIYNGQCVSLIKALLEFLGAPDPYAGRGNAKDVGDTLLRQGIAADGKGWLNVCVNRDMGLIGGVRYGHIWLDIKNEVNYEQNGSRALYTTKNTRPISQAQQIVNLDQYITEEDEMITKEDVGILRIGHSEIGGWDLHRTHAGEYDKIFTDYWVGKPVKDFIWAQWSGGEAYRYAKEQLKVKVAELENALNGTKTEIVAAQKAVAEANAKVAEESAKATEAGKRILELEAQNKADEEAGTTFFRRVGQWLSKLFTKKEG